MQPTISIIVPIYKVENYLERCINSILNQSFKNFELILVDDGSPDRCGEICDEYASVNDIIEEENYSAILIRPFRYIKEKDILRFLDALNIHYVFSPKFRLEKETAQLLDRLEKTYSPFTKPNVLKSRRNVCVLSVR